MRRDVSYSYNLFPYSVLPDGRSLLHHKSMTSNQANGLAMEREAWCAYPVNKLVLSRTETLSAPVVRSATLVHKTAWDVLKWSGAVHYRFRFCDQIPSNFKSSWVL